MAAFQPDNFDTHDLGTSTYPWKTLFVDEIQLGTRDGVSGSRLIIGSGNKLPGQSVDIELFGNLIVHGSTTTLESQTLVVEDSFVKLAKDNTTNSIDIGLYGQYDEGGGIRYSGLARDASDGKWKLFTNAIVEPTTTFDGSSSGHLKAGTFEGMFVGNADSATVLQTSRDVSISGDISATAVSFNGSSNIALVASIGASKVTNTMLVGSISNDKLSNSSVSFGGVSLSLGDSDASPAFNLADATGYPTSSLVGTITNAQLAGSINNDKLSNSSVSFGGVSLSLGGSDASPAFNLADATGYPTSSLVGTISDEQLAQDYIKTSEVDGITLEFSSSTLKIKDLGVSNSKLLNSSITFTAGTNGSGSDSVALGETLTINGTTNEIDVSVSTNSITLGLPTNITVSGTMTRSQMSDFTLSTNEVATTEFTQKAALNISTKTSSYTLTLSDIGKLVEFNSSSDLTLTIPSNLSVAFPIGTQIIVSRLGTGKVNFVISSDTLLSASSYTYIANQYSAVTLVKRSSTQWYLFGDLSAS